MMEATEYEATEYEKKIVRAFRDLCAKQVDGASPSEVTGLLLERGELAKFDTVIDIADQMGSLRDRGLLFERKAT